MLSLHFLNSSACQYSHVVLSFWKIPLVNLMHARLCCFLVGLVFLQRVSELLLFLPPVEFLLEERDGEEDRFLLFTLRLFQDHV